MAVKVELTECMKKFFVALTARLRQEIKTLLQLAKQLLEIELAKLAALGIAQDITSGYYKMIMAALEEALKPLEAKLTLINFNDIKQCPGLLGTFGGIQDMYFDKKNELLGFTYKYAQWGFATTYITGIKNAIQTKIDMIDLVIEYIDNIASLQLEVNDPVYVYTYIKDENGQDKYPITKEGTILSKGATTVTVSVTKENDIDVSPPKTETFDFSAVQPKG